MLSLTFNQQISWEIMMLIAPCLMTDAIEMVIKLSKLCKSTGDISADAAGNRMGLYSSLESR